MERSPLGFKSLRQRGGTEPSTPDGDTTRQSTGLPEKPKPGWWPDEPTAAVAPGEDANLHVGRGLRLKGEVSSCDRLTVEGDVEATIAARVLEISASGQVKGSAEVEAAEIDGRFDGQLTVRGCLSVRRSGQVTGTVIYDALEVEKGGCVTGDLTRTASTEDASMPVVALASPDTVVEDEARAD
ncbi:MAG: polymer-forming cytoskeletal protein [Alphaproteobacteria bacterium]